MLCNNFHLYILVFTLDGLSANEDITTDSSYFLIALRLRITRAKGDFNLSVCFVMTITTGNPFVCLESVISSA